MPRKPNTTIETYNDPFPTALRELIKENGTKQEELARVLGVKHRQSVTGYIDGSTLPTPDKIVAVAKHFHVTTDYLLGESIVQTIDVDLDAVCRYTGLSPKAVGFLKEAKDAEVSKTVSKIVESETFASAITGLEEMEYYLDQTRDAVGRLHDINDQLPSNAKYIQNLDGQMTLVSGNPDIQSRFFNALLDLKEFLPKLRIQLFELSELWPELVEEITHSRSTIKQGKELCRQYDGY